MIRLYRKYFKCNRFRNSIVFSRMFFMGVFLSFLFCAPSRWASRIDWEDYTVDTLPTQEDYPNAGALVLLDEANLQMGGSSAEMTFSQLERHMIVKICNERGYDNANILIPYGRGTHVTGIKGRTIRPNGDIVTLKKDQIYDTNLYPSYIFYSDIRAKRFTMPAIEPGCIVEYRWNKTIGNFTFWTEWQFQHKDPVLVSRYNIRCPNHWDIHWKTYGVLVEPRVDEVPKGMKANHTWEVRDLPPLISEVGMPNNMAEVAHLKFSPIGVSKWEDIGSWFLELAEDRMNPNEAIREMTRQITEGAPSLMEKMERIYDYVRDHIRYIAIEVGIGGYQPHAAEDVFKNRYGDCKDMVALIVAMAKSVEMDVYPVLISTWQNGAVDTSLVSQAHFNHAIAYAVLSDSTEIWMDATYKSSGFGDLPWFDQGRLAFVIYDKDKACFQRTPIWKASDNCIQRKWIMRLDSTGSVNGSVEMLYAGIPAGEKRLDMKFMHPEEFDSWFGRELLSSYPNFKCDTIQFDGLDDLKNPFKIRGKFTSSKRLAHDDSSLVFQPGSLSRFNWHTLFGENKRRFDVELKYPLRIIDEIELRYPENWQCDIPFSKKDIKRSFGFIRYEIESNGTNCVRFKRDFQWDIVYIPKADYIDFKRFINQIADVDKEVIRFGFGVEMNNIITAIYN
jgi:hypothetical protein